ncbi:LysM domain protein [Pseudobythopirellula maris]|uniref:LysM domain protein n=1 Tax=Pseudobythopirellula maris TaxID=2527991 RepID=A0A5C5ZUV6_9BACT|nr:LysM domain-containing protein [Pseudobythopirellula maris]TWT90885.1 LysM domain protein [Pseudobythopirellula maris]
MSTIRPLATLAVLAALGVFLAIQINDSPATLATDESDSWGQSAGKTAASDAPSFEAPAFEAGSSGDEAPAFGDSSHSLAPRTAPLEAVALPDDEPVEGPGMGPSLGATLPPLPALPGSTESGSPELPLPANIPTASYNSPADGASPPKGISGQVPSLGTSYGMPQQPPAAAVASAAPAQPSSATASYDPPGYDQPSYDQPSYDQPSYNAQANASAFAESESTPIDFGQPAPHASPVQPPTIQSPVAQSPVIQSPAAGSEFDQAMPAIQAALDRNELTRAHLLLSQWRDDASLTAAQHETVNGLLSQLAGTVIYSLEHRLEPPHQVQPGETLETIAQQYNVPWPLLGKINGVASATAVQPGQVLKVVRGPFQAVVDLSDQEMVLLLDGRYAGRFDVNIDGLAADEGQWRVEQKQSPQATGAPSRYGAPAPSSPKLVLKAPSGSPTGPSVLLGASSAGAPGHFDHQGHILVASTDAEDVFDILSEGSEVVVRR